MKHVHLTWYLLVDGTHADPNDVAPDAAGVLRHKNGLAVALHENGVPQTIGVSAVENKNVEAAKIGAAPAAEVPTEPAPAAEPIAVIDAETKADMKPAPISKRYKTR